jgi:hypothetical protein
VRLELTGIDGNTVKSKVVTLTAIETYGEMNVQLHPVLTSGIIAGDWSDSRRGRLNSRVRSPDSHLIGCWSGLRTSVNELGKR